MSRVRFPSTRAADGKDQLCFELTKVGAFDAHNDAGHLTRLPGIPDRSDIKPGMAYFEGSGPDGASCGGCIFRGYYRSGKAKFDEQTGMLKETQRRTSGCREFFRMSHKHGPPVQKGWRACRYFEGVQS